MNETLLLKDALAAQKAGDSQTALKIASEVAWKHPDNLDAWRMKGLALLSLGEHQRAESCLLDVLRRFPGDPITLTNLAALYYNIGEDDKAICFIEDACFVQGDRPNRITCYILGLIQLKNGCWKEGWQNYEHRFAVGAATALAPPHNYWNGERLGPDQTLVVWAEQGLGDAIQMVRFVKDAKERSDAHVVLVVDPTLVRLFEGLTEDVIAEVELTGKHVSLCSLPHVLGVELKDVRGEPYLVADGVKPLLRGVSAEGLRLPRIGVCWQGSQETPELRDRSLPQYYADRLFDLGGVECRSLQYGERGFHPRDLYDTALAIADCDLVVTIDTCVAHLAGALGVPVWILLRYQGDFRWLRDRTDTPWYNSAKLYRQPKRSDWESVIHNVMKDLEDRSFTP